LNCIDLAVLEMARAASPASVTPDTPRAPSQSTWLASNW
jgi:hypothetical protein